MTDEDIKRLRDALKDVGSLRGIPSPRPFSKYDKGAHEMIHGVAPKLREAVAAIDTLTRERDEARSVAGACEESMRALAFYLGVGGYNADTFDPEVFHQKIWDGIDMATAPIRQFIERASKAEARAERAERVVERVRNPSAAARAAMSEALDRWYAVGTQRIPFRLPASAFYPVARALYDAATAHAKPDDTPQADIVGGEASEGGGDEKKTFARGEPLTWNVMGDGR